MKNFVFPKKRQQKPDIPLGEYRAQYVEKVLYGGEAAQGSLV